MLRTLCLGTALFIAGSCTTPEPSSPAAASKQRGFTNPEAAIRAFCELDAHGKRLLSCSPTEALSFYQNLVHGTSDPGWDNVVIISGFRIGKMKMMPGRAETAVTYTVTGKYTAGVTAFYKSKEKIEFRVIETETGWKIQGPVVHPHTYPASLIQCLQNRVKNAPDAKERKKIQNDINVIKNMKRFSLGADSIDL